MYDRVFKLVTEIVVESKDRILEGFVEYKNWYLMEGGKERPDVDQLKWILESPDISETMKHKLKKKISDRSAALEDESDVLFKVGYAPNVYAACVKESTEREIEARTREFAANLALCAGGLIAFASLYYLAESFTEALHWLTLATSLVCFGLSWVFAHNAIEARKKIEHAEETAMSFHNSIAGRNIQERLEVVKIEGELFFELNKYVVKTSD